MKENTIYVNCSEQFRKHDYHHKHPVESRQEIKIEIIIVPHSLKEKLNYKTTFLLISP